MKKFGLTRSQTIILLILASLDCLVICALVVSAGWLLAPSRQQAAAPVVVPAGSPAENPPAVTSAETSAEPQRGGPTPVPTWTPMPTPGAVQVGFVSDYCPFNVPDDVDVECGAIDVPELRGDPEPGVVRLPVAIYHSTAENPAPDPVIFLSGGPGGSAVEPIARLSETFIAPLLEERDVIVFDQRGTGRARPALACPDYIAVPMSDVERSFRANSRSAEAYVNNLLDCRDWLRRRDIRLEAYTSAASAADVNDIVRVLGYERVNLYGGSYGTRLALTVMRDYPEIVRSAVLDSAVPVELNIYTEQAAKTAYAWDAFFDGCAADPACSAAYPNLEETYYDLLERLDRRPLLVIVDNPRTGWANYFYLDDMEMMGLLFFSLQVTDFIPYLPQMIDELSHGRTGTLSWLLSIPLGEEEGSPINIGVLLSVNCHEEVFATTPEEIETRYAEYPRTEDFARAGVLGNAQTYYDLCTAWGAAPFEPREGEPVHSEVPTLVIAGEFDSATPPPFGLQVADNLVHSYYYEFPRMGHTPSISYGGCPLDVALAFLDVPNVPPEPACLVDPGPEFVID